MSANIQAEPQLLNAPLQETGVVIVGGGPVGMGLAIDLGQRNIPCIVVERHREPQPVPKGQNLTQRTMEHFQAWGVEDRVRNARVIPRELGIKGLTTYGNLLSDYYYDWFQRDQVAQYYFAANERLPQYETEAVLRARAAELDSVELLYGFDAVDVTEGGDCVSVGVQSRDNSEQRFLLGRYVVGCDGSNSVVRRAVGIEQHSDDHEKHMVLLVFRSKTLHALLERYPGKSYFNVINPKLDGYWQFFGRVDYGETFFFHAPVAKTVTADNFDFTDMLNGIVGEQIQPEFVHVGFWDLRIASAKQYVKGRAFVAGDAAHSHPPYGGYGINTGFEDARNLGWKLAAVFEGWAGKNLLDSYDKERRPVFESTAKHFINRYIETDREFINKYDPEENLEQFEAAWTARGQGSDFDVVGFAPHYSGSPIVRNAEYPSRPVASGANASHAVTALAGHHLTPVALSASANIYDCLGPGYTLLHATKEKATALRFKASAAMQGVPLTIIQDENGDAVSAYGSPMVLIRPDHYVAWVK